MRPNHTGNNHPQDSTSAVMRLLVKIQSRNSSEARKWQSWMKSVGNCACPKSEDEREKKFGLGTCRFHFPDTSQIKAMAIETVNTWWNKLGQWSSLLANHQPSLVFFHDFFPAKFGVKRWVKVCLSLQDEILDWSIWTGGKLDLVTRRTLSVRKCELRVD